MVSHHGEQGPSGTGLFHWEWTGGRQRVGRGPDVRAARLARGARHRHVTTMPDPLELDRPLRGLRVVDTTDATSWSSARLLADLGADVIRVEHARPRRRRALRDAQRQQALRRPRRRRRAARAARPRRHLVRDRRHDPRRRRRATRVPGARGRVDQPVRPDRSVLRVRGDARRRLRAVRSATRLPAPWSSAAAAARPARVRGRVGDGRVLRARRGVEPRGHGRRRSSRPLDPGGDDPDHRHAGRGRERASFRTRPAGHQRGVHRRLRASRVPHRRRFGATAGGELPAVAGAARVGR